MEPSDLYGVVSQFWVVWLPVVFVAIVWYAYRPRNRKRFEEYASIPLRDDEENGHGNG
jgi:cytochrome c oxidase cbb3-type subunit 4